MGGIPVPSSMTLYSLKMCLLCQGQGQGVRITHRYLTRGEVIYLKFEL